MKKYLNVIENEELNCMQYYLLYRNVFDHFYRMLLVFYYYGKVIHRGKCK